MLALILSLISATQAAEGTVLRIEGTDFFVDLGAEDHVQVGDTVRVVRVVEVPTPEGPVLSDRFTVGEAVIVEVGASLTLVHGDPELRQQLRLGDVVIAPEHEPVDPPVERVERSTGEEEAEPSVAQPDPAVQAFLVAFERAAATSDPAQRRRVWQAFLSRHPEGATAQLAREELAALDAMSSPGPGQPAVVEEPFQLTSFARAPAMVDEDTVLQITVTVPELARVTEGWLYYRREGEDTYRRVVLDQMGDTALVGRVPAEAVQAPAVEWYVSLNDWELGEVNDGDPRQPYATEVQIGARARTPENRSEIELGYEWVNFYVGLPVDRWHSGEAHYSYRIDRSILHRVGVGYGYMQGVGASVQDIRDRGADADVVDVGFKYGAVEAEVAFTPLFGVIVQGLGGVQKGGFDLGAAAKVRVGREEGTNLMLGALTLGDLGNAYEIQLAWDTVERVPMQAGVFVTNQPGVSTRDYGVRLRYEARYELTEHLQVGARAGYQLRNITHTGPSLGATMVLSW